MADNDSGLDYVDSLSSGIADENKDGDLEQEEIKEAKSGGFPDPLENEDPFNPTQPLHTDPPGIKEAKVIKSKTKSISTADGGTGKSVLASKKGFKVLKPPRLRSNDSVELLDPEEEKLKMLPDCCEFVKKNEGYEADDSRKDMTSAWFATIKLG
ncbi:unnamed protein product [Orchesella dallaii]|uniref:Uncharacterized protein n=1 Tax=Orchesella dallaii TaxID=48710 RepID=A0ABP1QH29_9HEXA